MLSTSDAGERLCLRSEPASADEIDFPGCNGYIVQEKLGL
jgi:hypothetical protein